MRDCIHHTLNMSKTHHPTVAEFLTAHIALSTKSQAEIAHECGFERPNVLTMMKQGKMKVPVARAPAIALALGIDPFDLISRVMQEYEPETWQVIQNHFAVAPRTPPRP